MKIIIDGSSYEANFGEFILDIARRNNINIPTLCHSDALPEQGTCRLCVVEIIENTSHKIVTSCIYPVTSEIEVITNSKKVLNIRRVILQLLSSNAPDNELINKLKADYGVSEVPRMSSNNVNDCILCGLCVRACETVGTNAISTVNRGISKKVSTPYDEPSLNCIGCGACAEVCPTSFIKIKECNGIRTIWDKDFQLLSCEKCGSHFISREQLDYIKSKNVSISDNDLLCDKCKKSELAEKLKDIYKNSQP